MVCDAFAPLYASCASAVNDELTVFISSGRSNCAFANRVFFQPWAIFRTINRMSVVLVGVSVFQVTLQCYRQVVCKHKEKSHD